MLKPTVVTNELVRMLSQLQRTSQGFPGLKLSLNSVLPVAWIIRLTTDLKLLSDHSDIQQNFIIAQKQCSDLPTTIQRQERYPDLF